MPEHHRTLLAAARSINPAVWQVNEDGAPYLDDDFDTEM